MEGFSIPFSASYAALLFWTVATPLLAAAFLLLAGSVSRFLSQMVAGLGFGFPLIGALILAVNYSVAPAYGGFSFYGDMPLGASFMGISLKLGLNGISLPLFVMSAVVGLAAGAYAMVGEYERRRSYVTLLLITFGGLLGLFASVDLFFFYFFHELALIPTFIMIGVWGGRSRRTAAMEMTVYLTLGAMIVLAGMIALYIETGAASFSFITLREIVSQSALEGGDQHYIFGLLLIGFGILVSLFPFHTWAPRGYANAPASAAMLHAGVLKKFGLYGLIQIAAPLLPQGAAEWMDLLLWLALGNVVIIGLITIAQRDLRAMLGYGSVMHMGYAFLGFATLSTVGIGGAVMMMFAHGCSIALLFLLADCITRRGGTSEMSEFGGMARHTPILSAFFVAAILASAGLPGFANFWGELSVFLALFAERPWFGAAAILGIIISAVYGLRAVTRIFYGEMSDSFADRVRKHPVADISYAERAPALLLFAALLLAGLWPRFISDMVDPAVSSIYNPVEVNTAEAQPAETGVGFHSAETSSF